MLTREQMYKHLYVVYKSAFIYFGNSEDEASRKANIKCVKNTEKHYQDQFKEER